MSDQQIYGSDLVACTDATSESTYFRNDSDTVWVVSQPAGLQWKAAAPTISAEVYREQRALTKSSLSRRALVDCAVEGFTVG